MGIMSKLLGGNSHSAGDYVELDASEFETGAAEAEMEIRFASISEQTDVIDIKDAVYDGDIVQKDDDQIIITPGGVAISRSKMGSH